MAKKIMNFIFGKFPQIFNKKGEISHDLGDESWDQWKNRYKTKEYNWKNHSGRNRNIKSK